MSLWWARQSIEKSISSGNIVSTHTLKSKPNLLSSLPLSVCISYSWILVLSYLFVFTGKDLDYWILLPGVYFKWQCSPGSDSKDDDMVLANCQAACVYSMPFGWTHFLILGGPWIRGDAISLKSLGLSQIIFRIPNLCLYPVPSRVRYFESRVLVRLFYPPEINWPARHSLFFSVPYSL